MTPSRKRKAPEELSTNKHTVKARNREAAMSEVELKVEKAKKADAAAIGYTLKCLKASAEWQSTSEDARTRMKQAASDRIIQKR